MPHLASCPLPAEIEHFLLGRLSDVDSIALEDHIETCVACQERLATVAAEDDFVRAMRTRQVTANSTDGLLIPPDYPDELVNLLIPHLKRIAVTPEAGVSLTGGPSSGESPASLSTFVPDANTPGTPESRGLATRALGPYSILGVLGSGGMGTVLHGYDPVLRRSVAIKVVQSKLLELPGMAERLVREAQAAAAVEHDNIVIIHAVETLAGVPCIVMPLLRGMTLRERLEEIAGPLPLTDVLRIARETASGLAAAHACGLVHCDIKPANLWLEEASGRVKILDFGLAVARDDDDDDSEGISGTPGYLAPEQARRLLVDQRTDIFSLGCVLYRMATGRPPFTGERRMRALWTVLSEPPTPAIEQNPELPRELSELIGRMLTREPAGRPASATEVLETLDSIELRLVRQRAEVTRRRWLTALIVVATLSGSTVGLWAFFMMPRIADPVEVTIVGDQPAVSVVLRRDGQEQAVTLGGAQTLVLVPGDYFVRQATAQPGRSLVPDRFQVVEGKPQTVRLALVGELSRDATHTLPVTGVAVLPGSNPPQILSVGLDRTLVAWDTALKAPRPIFVDLPHAARCVAVSPNGHEIATAGGNKQPPAELAVRIWDARRLIPVGDPLAGHSRMVTALAYSPDGHYLASAAADGIYLWNRKTGESHLMSHPDVTATFALAYSTDGRSLLSGNDAGQVVLWDTTSRTKSHSYIAGHQPIRAVAFLPDWIVAAGDDHLIHCWSRTTFETRELLGHRQEILALAASPDGQLLSGDAEGTIRVWSVASGQTTHSLTGHKRAVPALAMTGNGRQVVSGSADGTVRLWQLPFPVP